MKVEVSLSRWSKLDYVLGSIVATVMGHKIRPNDALYGDGSHSCYGTVAKRLKRLDPTLDDAMFHVICFAQPGVVDEPQHCILTRGYTVIVSTWEGEYIRKPKTGGKILGMRFGDEQYDTILDLTSPELLQQYG